MPWLAEGNFWLVAWSEADVNVSWTDVFGNYDANSYSMKLGPAVQTGNFVMHEIILAGNTEKLAPKWHYIGADGNGDIYASMGINDQPQLLYSPSRGIAGAGFYADFAEDNLVVSTNAAMVPSNFTGADTYFQGLTQIGYSASDVDYDAGAANTSPATAPSARKRAAARAPDEATSNIGIPSLDPLATISTTITKTVWDSPAIRAKTSAASSFGRSAIRLPTSLSRRTGQLCGPHTVTDGSVVFHDDW